MSIFRDEFPQSPGLCYLNHAAVAPWPRRAAVAVQRFADENLSLGASRYLEWMKVETRLRERLMRLINAPSVDDIALLKNTSEALSFVASGLTWAPGDQIVISDEEFPSNRIVWEALSAQGVELVQVSIAGSDPEAALLEACGPRTRLMAISAVQYASGLRLDLARLGQGCKARDVLFCIDAIQQLGALPFDVQAYDCDFAMADGHKWLLAPEGLALFYCRAELRPQLKLTEYGWHMVEHMGDYNRSDWQPAQSARRFECGSPNMLAVMALEASLSLFEDIGMAQVSELILQRIDWLREGLAAIPGVKLHSPQDPARRSGILCFSIAGKDHKAVWEQLMSHRVICIPRGPGLRFSPHFYTERAVIDEALRQVRLIAMQ